MVKPKWGVFGTGVRCAECVGRGAGKIEHHAPAPLLQLQVTPPLYDRCHHSPLASQYIYLPYSVILNSHAHHFQAYSRHDRAVSMDHSQRQQQNQRQHCRQYRDRVQELIRDANAQSQHAAAALRDILPGLGMRGRQ